MSVVPLSNAQAAAVRALVQSKRLRAITGGGDERRARSFMAHAEEAYANIANISGDLVKHDLAYAVMHDVGEAMLAGYGFRTAAGIGQHDAVARFLAAIFDAPPPSDAARRVDDARRNRNDRYYRAHTPSTAETNLAVEDADILLTAARSRLTDP